ncbi:MAG: hypothetical protein ACRDDY_03945 [Clostridium sp.]|uniref:hypothetical protein n=1 Tax=Clostridium sp. TaxID=1506 RepID=UPI003EE5464D
MAEKTIQYWETQIEKAQSKLDELITGDSVGVKMTKSGDDEIMEHTLKEQMDYYYRYISYCEGEIDKLKESSNKIGLLFIGRDKRYG